ncbi:hypothetical protein LOD99_14045 [Oopsacas minuta]|uniref:MACPF domain-containing protein n=1 Tax=Oopsacas minuta TaxID=111878 RepID=A0AAV7KIC0_9METZ|nr:hypothetical protein LOD99_14045 [Oopsacas minuta]
MAEYFSNPETTEEEVESSKITTESIRKDLALPDSFLQAHNLHQKRISHPGMEMVGNSLKAHRSCNEAIIFVYGLTGAGKTSTLNHLFGFELIKIKEYRASDTKHVTEYVAKMESIAWRVTNLQIGFIDVPGWADVKGEEQDILNMALIDHFISEHPYLGSNLYKCYPSIVMVVIDATDKRLKGENAQIVRMFRAFTKLDIIDKDRPNLLIILTHVMDVGKKFFKERLNSVIDIVNELSICYLQVKPVIVYIENEYDDKELKVKGDWTVLKDGTLQPKNVFEGMIEITSKHKDEVGQEAIRLYFASRGNNEPVIKKQSTPDQLRKHQLNKWKVIITKEFSNLHKNEVNRELQRHALSNPGEYSDNSLVLLMTELHNKSLTQLNTLRSMKLNKVQQELYPYKLSQLENKALIEGCGVKPYEFKCIIQHIGYGRIRQTGEVASSQIIALDHDCHVQEGVSLSKSILTVIPIKKRLIEWKRLSEFVLGDRIDQIHTQTEEVFVKYQLQIIYNIYAFNIMLLDEKLKVFKLTPGFEQSVKELPENSIGEGNHVEIEYAEFLEKYGYWVIVGCECGGSMQGEIELKEGQVRNSQKQINTYITNILDKLETQNNNTIQESSINEGANFDAIGRIVLDWKGGDNPGNSLTFNNLNSQILADWMYSLYQTPINLNIDSSSEERNLPIYEFVSLVNPKKSDEFKKIFNKLDPEYNTACNRLLTSGTESPFSLSKSKSINHTLLNNTRERLSEICVSNTLRVARGGFPQNSWCIRGCFQRFSEVFIQDIVENDEILCRDPLFTLFKKAGPIQKSSYDTRQGFGDDSYEYIKITHEYGDITIGHKHTLLVKEPYKPPEMKLVTDIKPEDVIYYIDVKQRKTLKTKVTNISQVSAKGNYKFQTERFSMVAINQVITGGEDYACFPGNACVILKGGNRVRMDELKIGDYVLSIHPTTYKPVYSKVYIWAHRDTHITATFLHITHPHGHLHISANHLILTGDNKRPVPAHQLRVGDTIHFLSPPSSSSLSHQQEDEEGKQKERRDSHTLISVPVLHIDTCTHKGYYAPFTNNGLIVVDNIAASVYSHISTHSSHWLWHRVTSRLVHQFGMHRVGQCVLTPVRVGCKLDVGVLSELMDTHTHIHNYCQWLLDHCY